VYQQSRSPQTAVWLYNRALAKITQLEQAAHSSTESPDERGLQTHFVRINMRLAQALFQLGRTEEALKALQVALTSGDEATSPKNRGGHQARLAVALASLETSRPEQAEQVLLECLSGGLRDKEKLHTLLLLAKVYRKQKNFTMAETVLGLAQTAEGVGGPEGFGSLLRAQMHLELGLSLSGLKQYPKAIDHLETARGLFSEAVGRHDKQSIDCLSSLADVLTLSDRLERARLVLSEVLMLTQESVSSDSLRNFGPNHRAGHLFLALTQKAHNLRRALAELDEPLTSSEAVGLLESAELGAHSMELRNKYPEEIIPSELGAFARDICVRHLRAAKDHLQKAVRCVDTAGTPHHPRLVPVLRRLSTACHFLGLQSESSRYSQRADGIESRVSQSEAAED
jgi:tetratricopeptide (TPR) repeat protein